MGFTDYYAQQHHSVQPPQKHSTLPGGLKTTPSAQSSTSSKYDYCPLDVEEEEDELDGKTAGKDPNQNKLSDQEILESTEAIYFDGGSNTGLHELKVKSDFCFVAFAFQHSCVLICILFTYRNYRYLMSC